MLDKQIAAAAKFLNVFGYVMVALYFVFGIWILTTSSLYYLSSQVRIVFACLMFAFGAFRFVRAYYRAKVEKLNNNEVEN